MTNKEAKIITVFNEKGGSGKTTTTCQLAGTLGLRGYDVLVADLDPQQTSAKWLTAHDGANFKGTLWTGFRYGAGINAELAKFRSKFDIIILDCAPSVEQPATSHALLVSDLALIPTKLNPPDLDALAAAKVLATRAIERLDAKGAKLPVRVVPIAARMHMNDDKAAVESLRMDHAIPLLGKAHAKSEPIILGDRKAYTRSMLVGATAHSLKGGEESVKELEAMADSVLKLIGLPAARA